MTPTGAPLSVPPAVDGVKCKERPATAVRPAVYYPESDGEPIAETDVHRKQMVYLIEALTDYFRDDPQVYVAGNLWYRTCLSSLACLPAVKTPKA